MPFDMDAFEETDRILETETDPEWERWVWLRFHAEMCFAYQELKP